MVDYDPVGLLRRVTFRSADGRELFFLLRNSVIGEQMQRLSDKFGRSVQFRERAIDLFRGCAVVSPPRPRRNTNEENSFAQ